ncbi:MAG: sigma-70 family RNA polymerase sigma factor [Candidatus Binatia bacterium]
MGNGASTELKELLEACAEGQGEARRRFQELFGEIIYNCPMKRFHVPSDKAADFYIYVFENDRIFRRVRGFEGRNDAQFRTYLSFYVLRDLFIEWQRTQKRLETISLATVINNGSPERAKILEDLLPDPKASGEDLLAGIVDVMQFKNFLEKLEPESRLLLKLLYFGECELSPQEIRIICKKTGRSYREIVYEIEEIKNRLLKKDEQLAALEEQLESIHGWILLYQKELKKVSERIGHLQEDSPQYADECRQREELQRKLEWRYRQKGQALEKRKQFRITTPYKDIARLLSAPIGTVCSLVARSREEVSGAMREVNLLGEAVVT